jgi:hypothetical protein
MAVENLAIISSPLAGLAMSMNGGMGSIQTWMTAHGIRPLHMGVGAVIGAIVTHGGILEGALRGAAIVGGFELALYLIARHVGSP